MIAGTLVVATERGRLRRINIRKLTRKFVRTHALTSTYSWISVSSWPYASRCSTCGDWPEGTNRGELRIARRRATGGRIYVRYHCDRHAPDWYVDLFDFFRRMAKGFRE